MYINPSIHACIHAYIHTYITLHYTTLHCITSHYITLRTLHPSIHPYIHTYMHACMHCIPVYIHNIYIYIHTYIHTWHTFITFIHYIHSFLPSFIHSFIHAFVHSFIRSFMHAVMHAYTHTCTLACIQACMHTAYIYIWLLNPRLCSEVVFICGISSTTVENDLILLYPRRGTLSNGPCSWLSWEACAKPVGTISASGDWCMLASPRAFNGARFSCTWQFRQVFWPSTQPRRNIFFCWHGLHRLAMFCCNRAILHEHVHWGTQRNEFGDGEIATCCLGPLSGPQEGLPCVSRSSAAVVWGDGLSTCFIHSRERFQCCNMGVWGRKPEHRPSQCVARAVKIVSHVFSCFSVLRLPLPVLLVITETHGWHNHDETLSTRKLYLIWTRCFICVSAGLRPRQSGPQFLCQNWHCGFTSSASAFSWLWTFVAKDRMHTRTEINQPMIDFIAFFITCQHECSMLLFFIDGFETCTTTFFSFSVGWDDCWWRPLQKYIMCVCVGKCVGSFATSFFTKHVRPPPQWFVRTVIDIPHKAGRHGSNTVGFILLWEYVEGL